MEKKILEFACLLRKAGVRVTQTEITDGLKALSLVGLKRNNFYNALAATLIKDEAEFLIYDKLFSFFFDVQFFGHQQERIKPGIYSLLPQPAVSPEAATGNCCPGKDTEGDSKRSTGFGHGQGLATVAIDDFVQVIKIGDSGEMARLVKKGVESLGPIRQEDLTDIRNAIRQVKIFLEWNMGVYRLENEACHMDEATALLWQERQAQLEVLLHRELERQMINSLGASALETLLIRENLNELDFYSLTDPQIAEINKKVIKLAHRLSTRISFRMRRARHGVIDLPKTIRKSMSTGGIPIRPSYKNKYPTRPEFVVLCDVSGSVRQFSEFILQLVYSMQNRFFHMRSFAFIDTPDEITDYLRNEELADGLKNMYNKALFSKTAFSDYGQMFIDFCQKFLSVLSPKTTLLIIGDARNNYQKEHIDYFMKMVSQVKKVIWLNPEPAEEWDREDSIMSLYGGYCSKVFECQNLHQLDKVAQNLFNMKGF